MFWQCLDICLYTDNATFAIHLLTSPAPWMPGKKTQPPVMMMCLMLLTITTMLFELKQRPTSSSN